MIYLDNASTTRIYKSAQEARDEAEDLFFGNSSSLHSLGLKSHELIDNTKEIIAKEIGSSPSEIYFTKGATESNNIAIKSMAKPTSVALTTSIEHSSVYESFKNNGFKEVIFLKNNKYGFIDIDDLKDKLNENVSFVSIIYVNNEVGTIQDIREISKLVKEYNNKIIIHIDATQALGKIPCNVRDLGVDMMSFSSHKFHGPKGVGGLYVRKDVLGKVRPVLFGGGQQVISSGTDNHPGIYAMGIALDKQIKSDEYNYIDSLNKYMRKLIKDNIEDSVINTPDTSYSPYILSVGFADIKSEVLLHMLEEKEIYVSSGSACAKGDNNRILEGLGLDSKYRDGVIRFSFSSDITKEDLDYVVDILKESIKVIRKVYKWKNYYQ